MNRRFDDALVWFRRDLRDFDHAALAAATASARRVHCVFVFDTGILQSLNNPLDRRVSFIHASLVELDHALRRRGGGLIVRHGDPVDWVPRLARELRAGAVFVNRDYEPSAKSRDHAVQKVLATDDIVFLRLKDQAVLDADDVLTRAGTPFSVFTPYRNAWLSRVESEDLSSRAIREGSFVPTPASLPSLASLGFGEADLEHCGIRPGMSGARAGHAAFLARIEEYAVARDCPALDGTSRLSVHLRFGTISVRELVRDALRLLRKTESEGVRRWLDELVWRDFYFMVLDRNPHVVSGAFRARMDRVEWVDDPTGLAAWQNGQTGYPLVDAAMRQLLQTGFMHNRLRMLTASFLTKDLGVDWRAGERFFAEHLNDYDLAANNGGWQWSASTGCDAQPWFRIFNPTTQARKFDPEGQFVRRYVPELAAVPSARIHEPWRMTASEQQAAGVSIGADYPAPIVDHAVARQKTLARFRAVDGAPL